MFFVSQVDLRREDASTTGSLDLLFSSASEELCLDNHGLGRLGAFTENLQDVRLGQRVLNG